MNKSLPSYLIYAIPALASIVVIVGISVAVQQYPSFSVETFYADKLRGSLFAGFLTLGSFLLSLKTGIVIKIKEGLFDNVDYKKRLDERRQLNPDLSTYGPLRRLAKLLSNSVLAALVTAALQLTLGLVPHWLAATLCIATAVFALSLLLSSFYLIQSNLNVWFDLMDDVEKKRCEALTAEKKSN